MLIGESQKVVSEKKENTFNVGGGPVPSNVEQFGEEKIVSYNAEGIVGQMDWEDYLNGCEIINH